MEMSCLNVNYGMSSLPPCATLSDAARSQREREPFRNTARGSSSRKLWLLEERSENEAASQSEKLNCLLLLLLLRRPRYEEKSNIYD